MRALKELAGFAILLTILTAVAFPQSQTSVEMRVTVLWADGHRLNDKDEVQGIPGASDTKTSGSGQRVAGNAVSNMDIRLILLNEDGSTVRESSPDSEGTVKFVVVGSVTNSSTGTKAYPVYRLRVRGTDIEEQFVDNLQPGLADRMVTVQIHRKGEKKPGGGIVSATALKIPRKAEKEFTNGQKALAKNKLPEARDKFRAAVAIYPNYDMAWNSLGVTLMKLGDAAEGRKAFEQALAANDKFAPAYVNLARIQGGEQNYDQAATSLSRALTLEPLNAEALSMLCQYDVLREKYDEVPALATKMHSVPHDGQALGHFAAATAFEHLNQPNEAIFEYMLFMKEDPTSKLSAAAKESADRLRQQVNQANAR